MDKGNKLYKCVNCGKPVPQVANKKHRLYCNDACRIAFKRKAKSEHVKSEQIKSEQPKADTLPNLNPLPHPVVYKTGTMTGFERTNYKPASELGKGEHNPVSKPGDEHYG